MASTKKYEAPAVKVLGSLTELTLGSKGGTHLDASFSAGTPITQITTS